MAALNSTTHTSSFLVKLADRTSNALHNCNLRWSVNSDSGS